MSEAPGTDLVAETQHELPGAANQAVEVDSSLPPKFRHKRSLAEPSPIEEATETESLGDVAAAGPSGSQATPAAAPLDAAPPRTRANKHSRDSPSAGDLAAAPGDPAADLAQPKRSPEDGGDDDGDEDGDEDGLGVLRRGHKATRLSISKIQGRAEPRKPRIGPQYQAIVPPWLPGV